MSHFHVHWFFKMLLDEIFYEAWPSLQENLFDWLKEAWCCWAEECRMEILCQFWFSCMVQNVIYHNFWFLCLQGNFPHSSLLVSGAFYYLLSIFKNAIFCLSSVMVHPSSHKTLNHISGDAFIYGKMWFYLDCLRRPDSCSVAILLRSAIISPGFLAGDIWFWANFKIIFALSQHSKDKDEIQDCCSTPKFLKSCGSDTNFYREVHILCFSKC